MVVQVVVPHSIAGKPYGDGKISSLVGGSGGGGFISDTTGGGGGSALRLVSNTKVLIDTSTRLVVED